MMNLKYKSMIKKVYVLILLLSFFSCEKSDNKVETKSIVYNTLSDINGNVYKTVNINGQEWMAENLRATNYDNNGNIGKEIELVTGDNSNQLWANLDKDLFITEDPSELGIACSYNNSANTKYGLFYTYTAATGGQNGIRIQGACPSGWHLPSDEDWKELEKYLGIDLSEIDKIGTRGKLESKMLMSSEYWTYGGGVDNYGFSAFPTGTRDGGDGEFYYEGLYAGWWTSTKVDKSSSYYRFILNGEGISRYKGDNWSGVCIRCIKD